jgi:transcriptional regulator with XRE-family HTH domain
MGEPSELRNADEIHIQDMRDLGYRREYERTRLANDVAIKVIRYRVDHGLSQAQLARMLGWRQPNVARLEAGDHEPSLSTLARLSAVLGLDFSVTVKPDRMKLRYTARSRGTGAGPVAHDDAPAGEREEA